ncbi:MAG: hypothetical protein Q8M15_01870 [Bacteroidota bacterium]|nr:hypothetical protein [Bacteroidota bacterium]
MQKPLSFFLIFAASYILLNLLYQALLYYYTPLPDLFTVAVTRVTLTLLPNLSYQTLSHATGLQIISATHAIVNIKEGCNGIAVWIALLSFIIAFKSGSFKAYLIFIPVSFIIIQVCNVLRLYLLIQIKMNRVYYFDFFHTYIFPAIIYLFAFLLMVVWVMRFVKVIPVHADYKD